jgi:hypothetical protein
MSQRVKHQSMEWKNLASPARKFESQPAAEVMILSHFWHSEEPIFEHYLKMEGYDDKHCTSQKKPHGKLELAVHHKHRAHVTRCVVA